MKKSVFTLLAIAFAVITMSSCSQNDGGSSNDLNLPEKSQTNKTDNSQSQADAKKGDVYVAQFAISETMAAYGTFTMVVSDGTDSKTVDLIKEGQKVDMVAKDNDGKQKVMTCYKYTFTKQSSKPLSFKTVYTPNDATKQIDKDYRMDACFAFCADQTVDGKATSELAPRWMNCVLGRHIEKCGDYIAESLTKAF